MPRPAAAALTQTQFRLGARDRFWRTQHFTRVIGVRHCHGREAKRRRPNFTGNERAAGEWAPQGVCNVRDELRFPPIGYLSWLLLQAAAIVGSKLPAFAIDA